MNRIVVAALAAFIASAAHAATVELKVTPYEAGTEESGSPAIKVATKTVIGSPAVAKAASQYVVVARVTAQGQPIMQALYDHEPFADEAACTAFLVGDPDLKKAKDGLAEVVKVKIHPDAKVGVSCEELPSE